MKREAVSKVYKDWNVIPGLTRNPVHFARIWIAPQGVMTERLLRQTLFVCTPR
jgi:hypothetical protein